MKKILITLFALCLAAPLLLAVPARPGKFTYTQPDGSKIELRRFGDEFGHKTVNAAGQEVRKDADGYYRPVTRTETENRTTRMLARAKRASANARHVKAASNTDLNQGERHIPVVIAEFKDCSFSVSNPADKFNALLNTKGYSYNGALGSVRDYYEENSEGQFLPVFDVYGPVTLSSKMATYGGNDSQGNDKAPELALFQAAKALDAEVDFSQYDYDKDGVIDMVLFYYAGHNEAEGGDEDAIWPHSWDIRGSDNATITSGNLFDGIALGPYFCTSELDGAEGTTFCGIGVTCHEFGHSLGLPDFYDTDYGDSGDTYGENHGCAADAYSYSLMCSGSYNHDGKCPPYMSVEERILLGWLSPDAIQTISSSGSYTLPAVQNGLSYKTLTSRDGEYFLYECRSSLGWDKYLPGGPGLIVYHVDKSSTKVSVYDESGNETNVSAAVLWSEWETYNQLNENAKHPCYYIVPAQDQSRISYTCETGHYAGYPIEYDETLIPFPGNPKVTTYIPVDWAGVSGPANISNINYSDSEGRVTMKVSIPTGELDYCVIDNPGKGSYAAGALFPLNLVTPEGVTPQAVGWYFDDEPVSGTSVMLTSGVHTVEAAVTFSNGERQLLTLEISVP